MKKQVDSNKNIIYTTLNWNDIDKQCNEIYQQTIVKKYKPDCIIGLMRGGVIPSRIFSDFFNITDKLYFLDVKLYKDINKREKKPIIKEFDKKIITEIRKSKKIALIDDIWDTGTTIKATKEYLGNKGFKVTTITLCFKTVAKTYPDYFSDSFKSNEWVLFPWEINEFKGEVK